MNINLKNIANPFAIFSIAWSLCLFLYSLGWAEIFPTLSLNLFLFLSCLIIVFAITSLAFNKLKSSLQIPKKLSYKSLIIINTILYGINFLYSGIPLLKGIRDDDFGIPTIIVIATTLNCFTSVYCFYLFLLTRKIKFILLVLFCFSFFLLVFSRGNIIMSGVTMFFLWINVTVPKLNLKRLSVILSGAALVMYLFGVAGNYRSINDLADHNPAIDKTYNSNVIMGLGGASESFRNGPIPGEFFWTYIYITSPLSNLQYTINTRSPSFTLNGLFYIIIDELTFDSISKRIDALLGRKRMEPNLLVEQLTVPTALAGSYNYNGWGGVVFFMIIFWLFPFVYLLLINKNPLGIIGISTLCTVYFFSIFDNMFILSSLMLQIFIPVIMTAVSRINLKIAAA